ncbi:MAG TPA: nucleotide-binding protein [Longimicrobium sp.]|nr:nucleotide-binding protein [Longimicrobium sp.]
MTNSERPLVFVGSSAESLDVAYAVQENLEFSAEVTVWSQGLFVLTRTALQSLHNLIETFDFAVFVFAPDDVARIRNQESPVVRDNVVFELGMFLGKLGPDRSFIVTPRASADLHLPSDLLGVTPATYDAHRRDKNLVAALGPACTRMRRAMDEIGLRATNQSVQEAVAPVAAGLGSELRGEIARMLRDQEARIARIVSDFESRLTKVTARGASYQPKSLNNMLRDLSPEAVALLFALRRVHLTSEQYQRLHRSRLGPAIEELRDASFLVPLQGVDEQLPVYWFPTSTIQNVLFAHIDAAPTPDPIVIKQVNKLLSAVGYKG